jgi:hypothetical protein
MNRRAFFGTAAAAVGAAAAAAEIALNWTPTP